MSSLWLKVKLLLQMVKVSTDTLAGISGHQRGTTDVELG